MLISISNFFKIYNIYNLLIGRVLTMAVSFDRDQISEAKQLTD